MEREECWMTFSEALEQYLDKRECFNGFSDSDCYKDSYENDMRDAAQHMDALTSFIPHVHGTRET